MSPGDRFWLKGQWGTLEGAGPDGGWRVRWDTGDAEWITHAVAREIRLAADMEEYAYLHAPCAACGAPAWMVCYQEGTKTPMHIGCACLARIVGSDSVMIQRERDAFLIRPAPRENNREESK